MVVGAMSSYSLVAGRPTRSLEDVEGGRGEEVSSCSGEV